jgi:succinate-acetate transporter protein
MVESNPGYGDGSQAVHASRVFLRPLANPLSLGFLGLAFATIMLSSTQLGWAPSDESHLVAIGVLVFAVPLQFVSCIYGFLVRDTVCATGIGVQAGMWAAIGTAQLVSPPGSTTTALGLMLVMGAVTLAMPASGATRSTLLAAAVLYATAARWALTAAYELSSSSAWETAAGAMGVLLAALALYASLAFEIEDQQRRTVLPTLRRGPGQKAMTAPLAEQVANVANEAGVRKQA